jgi:hypothetical protein
MGGAIIEAGSTIICDGNDVLVTLNSVFGHPNSQKYKQAKSNNTFGDIKNVAGNYKDLIAAYEKAGVNVNGNPGWSSYLMLLGTVDTEGPEQGPQNIYDIAQFRYNGLINDVPMKTVVHMPHKGGHVHHGGAAAPSTIDSPCPMPQPPTKK